MAPAASEQTSLNQDSTASIRLHLKRVKELFDQYEAADLGASPRKARRERLMADMDHE